MDSQKKKNVQFIHRKSWGENFNSFFSFSEGDVHEEWCEVKNDGFQDLLLCDSREKLWLHASE